MDQAESIAGPCRGIPVSIAATTSATGKIFENRPNKIFSYISLSNIFLNQRQKVSFLSFENSSYLFLGRGRWEPTISDKNTIGRGILKRPLGSQGDVVNWDVSAV